MSDTKTVPTPIFSVGGRGKMAETVNHEHEHIYTGDNGMNTLGTAALLGQLGGGKTDAAALAAISGGGLGGLGGGLLPLLLLMFLGRGNGFGGDDSCRSGITAKDALANFQAWASTNAGQLSHEISSVGATLGQQICCTAGDIKEAVCGVNSSMLQAFANQATAINSGFAQGQLAAATNTAALQQTMSNHQALTSLQLNTAQGALTNQLTANAAAEALAACQIRNDIAATSSATQNQMAAGFAQASRERFECCCETKQEIVKGTKEVLEKIADLELHRVRAELDDAKTEISNLKQTCALEELIERRCRRCCIPAVPETVR